jgi:L-seryl-tRNA(Ser) seleniumtransferase
MLGLTREEIHARAAAFVRSLGDAGGPLSAEVLSGGSAVGGGAAPTIELPTALVALTHATLGASRLAARLREGDPPVVVRVAEDQVLLDLRTVSPESEGVLLEAVLAAAR